MSVAASVMLPFMLGSVPCAAKVNTETRPADEVSLIGMESKAANGVDGFVNVLACIGSHVRLTVTIDINVTLHLALLMTRTRARPDKPTPSWRCG